MTFRGYAALCILTVVSIAVATQLGEASDVLSNVALHKNITFEQSGVSEYLYSLAVDGKTDKTTPKGSCISIEAEGFIWWQLDLGEIYTLFHIHVIHTEDFIDNIAGIVENECYIKSMSYKGLTSSTHSGRTCQRWDSQYPHGHRYQPGKGWHSGTIHFLDNYCRSHSPNEGPWCYTTDPEVRWEYCDIKQCDREFADGITLKTGTNADNLTITNSTVILDDLVHHWVLILPVNTKATFIEFHHDGIKGYYHLCEVEVFGTKDAVTNVALHKTAEMSTIYPDSEYIPRLRADVLLDQNYEESSCLSTGINEEAYWWKVDLRNIYLIFLVRIYNYPDSLSAQAHNLTLSFWNSVDKKIEFHVGDIVEYVHQFSGNIEAWSLQLLYSGYEPIYLCEVEVFGQKVECQYNECLNGGNCSTQHCNNCRNYKCSCPTGYGGIDCEMGVENIAIGADIIASSIFYSRQLPRNIIDGDANQYMVNGATCVSTQKEIEPYFIIDLGAEYYLTNVNVYKRLDCCPGDVSGFELLLMVRTWKSYGYVSKTDDSIVTFDIYPYVSTRLVRIDGIDDEPAQLQLCEIEVLGISQEELTSDTAELDDRSNPFIQMRFTLTDKYSDVVKSEDVFIYSMREVLSNFTGYSVDSFQNTQVENDPFRVSFEVHPTHWDTATLNELLEKFDALLQQGVLDMKTEDSQKFSLLAGSLKYHVLYLENTGSTTNVSFLMTVIVVILQEARGALD